jgi:uncharacterized protein YfkK (UPF0435 family)
MNYIVEEKSVLDTAESKHLRKVYELVRDKKRFWVPESMYNEELFIKPLIWFQILKQEAGIE